MTIAKRTILLCGATGLVGRQCLRQLADPEVGHLHTLLRRPLPAAVIRG